MAQLSADQFAALAELLRLRGGASQEAARLVLVEGLAPAEAARQAGTTPQATSNVLASCRRGIELAGRVCSDDPVRPPEQGLYRSAQPE